VTCGRCDNATEMQRIWLNTWIIPCVLDSNLQHYIDFLVKYLCYYSSNVHVL